MEVAVGCALELAGGQQVCLQNVVGVSIVVGGRGNGRRALQKSKHPCLRFAKEYLFELDVVNLAHVRKNGIALIKAEPEQEWMPVVFVIGKLRERLAESVQTPQHGFGAIRTGNVARSLKSFLFESAVAEVRDCEKRRQQHEQTGGACEQNAA